jgi:endonuclease/exonuclease/phosphatase family metal-dependent hydrolase
MDELTVMTFNLLAPSHADWPRRREVIRAALRDLNPDIVALQECGQTSHDDRKTDLLDEEYHTAWHTQSSADGVSAVLASRFPFNGVREIDLRVTDRITLPWAAAILVEMNLPRPIGDVLVAHHKPTYEIGFSRERELQAVASARAIEHHLADRPNCHVIVLGDFDDTPDSASLRFWTGRQSLDGVSVAYRDAWEAVKGADPGHTFASSNPLVRAGEMSLELGRRIDYILVRSGIHGPTLDVIECHRALDQPVDGIWASDHYGVFARFSVPNHPPGSWQ